MFQEILITEKAQDLCTHLKTLNSLLKYDFQTVEAVTTDLIDKELIDEIKRIVTYENVSLCFGTTLRHIRLLLQDDEGFRKHEIFIEYKGPKKLVITSVKLPQSLQHFVFSSIEEVMGVVLKHVNELSRYFYELEHIDQSCTIMEPLNPSFKDDYRRILLDDRTWLHVEVTPDGFATNIHLIGQSEYWNDKLQTGLLNWDHDKDIVDNILTVFDLASFPQCAKSSGKLESEDETNAAVNILECSICLSEELPDNPGVPQPFCQNSTCKVYFHRICLYQWLVVCAGNRPPAFGVATGACPTCLQPIACNEKDN